MKEQLPDWIIEARNKWVYRGQTRPPFAVEPTEGQISVWDFPRPPAVEPVRDLIQIFDGNLLLAKSENGLMVKETANPPTYYFPAEDVDFSQLIALENSSWCEWKGQARYWALENNPGRVVAWDYPRPFAEYTILENFIAFYPQHLHCFVGIEEIVPQSSLVYAGWITKNLVGPSKGQPGSEHW